MRKKVGDEGESFAEKYLRKRGYKILERNYRTPIGEIDIVAKDGEYTVFIEVKTRQSLQYGAPIDAVDRRKRERIRRLALLYLKHKKIDDSPVRFDVVGLTVRNGNYEVELIKDAFEV